MPADIRLVAPCDHAPVRGEPMPIVVADIGGTHARFAIAEMADGRVTALHAATKLRTADHASLRSAWEAFAGRRGQPLPRAAAIAIAAPVQGDVLKLTNNPWTIEPRELPAALGLDALVLVNDFAAIGHAVAQVDPGQLRHLCGPDVPLPAEGVVGIVGPGTGLGVAQLVRRGDGGYHVVAAEGGHVGFAPLDEIEDAIVAVLRPRWGRVSNERLVSGPGLAAIYEVLARIEERPTRLGDERAIWTAALAGTDALAAAALERFCRCMGAVAGDIALAQGAAALVIAGGLGLRLADHLPRSGFAQRVVAKGRFAAMMARLPVKVITHPEPGLFGAAAAFARTHAA